MKSSGSALLGLILLCGCAAGPPRKETKSYPVLTFSQEFRRVKETTRIAMRVARFPIETLSDAGFAGPAVQDRGFRWKLAVALGRGNGTVSVSPTLEVTRETRIRPVHGALANMGAMGLEDQRSTALRSNPEAYSRDRQAMERGAPGAEREARIERLDARVHEFLKDLEARLRPANP